MCPYVKPNSTNIYQGFLFNEMMDVNGQNLYMSVLKEQI